MLQRILSIDKRPKHYDATDAVAVALCHHYQGGGMIKKAIQKGKPLGKKNSWQKFIEKNPQKIRS
jgi:crossover junction endodeoxyribonuclease RuvC